MVQVWLRILHAALPLVLREFKLDRRQIFAQEFNAAARVLIVQKGATCAIRLVHESFFFL